MTVIRENPQPEPSPGVAPTDAIGRSFRVLRLAGLTDVEAGNVIARMAGLGLSRTGWRQHEIEALVFLRGLVESGRIAS